MSNGKQLTKKAQAAWELILASGQPRIKYYSAGGAILDNGTKFHSHLVRSLQEAGLLQRVSFNPETGETIDPEYGWHFIVKAGK